MIRPLAVLALVAFTLGAAAKPAPNAARKTKPKLTDVRVQIVSGNRQDLRAYASASQSKYVVDFPKLLVVSVRAPQPKDGSDRIVVFTCVTPGCTFLSADQPDDGKHVDRVGAVYKVKIIHHRGLLKVILAGDRPTSDYVITAIPSPREGERALGATFTLTMH